MYSATRGVHWATRVLAKIISPTPFFLKKWENGRLMFQIFLSRFEGSKSKIKRAPPAPKKTEAQRFIQKPQPENKIETTLLRARIGNEVRNNISFPFPLLSCGSFWRANGKFQILRTPRAVPKLKKN